MSVLSKIIGAWLLAVSFLYSEEVRFPDLKACHKIEWLTPDKNYKEWLLYDVGDAVMMKAIFGRLSNPTPISDINPFLMDDGELIDRGYLIFHLKDGMSCWQVYARLNKKRSMNSSEMLLYNDKVISIRPGEFNEGVEFDKDYRDLLVQIVKSGKFPHKKVQVTVKWK